MSDEKKPLPADAKQPATVHSTPPIPVFPPPPPATAAPFPPPPATAAPFPSKPVSPAHAPLAAGQTPAGQPAGTVRGPALDYAMPSHKKSWLPSPALVRNLGGLSKMIFGFTVLIILGYFALVALNPKAREWATKGGKDGRGGPTPFKVLNQILAIPAQAIGKTKDVVAASDARVGVLDGVIKDEEGKGKKSAGHVVVDPFGSPAATGSKPDTGVARSAAAAENGGGDGPAEPQAARTDPGDPPAPAVATPPTEPAAPAQVKLAGGIIISSASPPGGPVVRASFFYWVVNQNISGVFQSPPHRIMLDKRLVYEGQEIGAFLGITFDHLDLANKLIVFRDKSGALVTRSY